MSWLEGQHLVGRQCPLGQQWQGTNLDPLNEGQCRDAAGIGAGLAQTDGGALCQQYLQPLAQVVTLGRGLPRQGGTDSVGHQEQLQAGATLLAQGNGQTQGIEQGLAAIGGAVGNDDNMLIHKRLHHENTIVDSAGLYWRDVAQTLSYRFVHDLTRLAEYGLIGDHQT